MWGKNRRRYFSSIVRIEFFYGKANIDVCC
jgi:hypothetical protein